MNTDTNLNKLFESLKNYGFNRKFIQEVLLPDWWDSEISDSKAGYLQALSIISKNLSLRVEDLIADSGNVILKHPLPVKFKTAKNISFSVTDIWPNSLAIRISEILDQIFNMEFENPLSNPLELRSKLLIENSQIDLNNLLDFLWSKGIPVIFISEFPQNVYKMDGMVVNYGGRPIILLSKSRKQDAWLLFILAHELGHIIKGHITESDSVIYDTDMENIENDDEENEANLAALQLLTGLEDPNLIKKKIPSAFELVNTARRIGRKTGIDPGTVVLNYANSNNDYPTAQQALKILNPKADAIALIKSKMISNLKLDELSEESLDYFSKITGITGD